MTQLSALPVDRKPILICYLNIGNSTDPIYVKKEVKNTLNTIKKGFTSKEEEEKYVFMCIPIRNGETRIEIL